MTLISDWITIFLAYLKWPTYFIGKSKIYGENI